MAGIDIPIPECQLVLHQPTIKEIAFIGEVNFFAGVQYLNIQKSMFIEDQTLLSTTSNFQLFITIMNEQRATDKKQAVLSVLNLLFPSYQIFFTPRSIMFNNDSGTFMIDEGNFEILQQVLAQVFCLKNSDQSSFNPANKKAQEIANKLMKARQKVAQQKSSQNGEGSALAQYVSSLVVGLHSMSLDDCLKLTIYQLYDLAERYSLYTNWDIDLRSRLAGAKADKPMENWMKNIH